MLYTYEEFNLNLLSYVGTLATEYLNFKSSEVVFTLVEIQLKRPDKGLQLRTVLAGQ